MPHYIGVGRDQDSAADRQGDREAAQSESTEAETERETEREDSPGFDSPALPCRTQREHRERERLMTNDTTNLDALKTLSDEAFEAWAATGYKDEAKAEFYTSLRTAYVTEFHAVYTDEEKDRMADELYAAYQNAEGDAKDEAWAKFCRMPHRDYHVVVTYGGKVHRVRGQSARFISSSPYCGSARWNSARARVVDAPVTCQKCLKW